MAWPNLIQTTEPTPAVAPSPDTRPMLVKALVLLGLAAAGLLACQLTPLKQWLAPAGQAATWVRQAGGLGAAVFVLGSGALILAGVPRLLFCLVAGWLYGFWLGLGLSLLATMLSYWVALVLVRGRPQAGHRARPLPARLAFLAQDPGLAGVVLARMLPMPGMVVTLALALSAVNQRNYLLGSLVGLVPEAAPVVLLGAGLLAPETSHQWRLALVVLASLLAAMALAVWLLKRRWPRPPTAAPAPAPGPSPALPDQNRR